MRLLALALVTSALCACGIDGPPVPPSEVGETDAPRTGVTVSGSAGVGVAGSF